MADYENEMSDGKKSKYNSAVAQLYRTDYLWQETHKHARSVSYPKWNEDLDRIWAELSADAEPKAKEEIAKFDDALNKLSLYNLNPVMKKDNYKLYVKLLYLQKRILLAKEIFLRVLQNKQGKGTAYEDTIEDYLDDGF